MSRSKDCHAGPVLRPTAHLIFGGLPVEGVFLLAALATHLHYKPACPEKLQCALKKIVPPFGRIVAATDQKRYRHPPIEPVRGGGTGKFLSGQMLMANCIRHLADPDSARQFPEHMRFQEKPKPFSESTRGERIAGFSLDLQCPVISDPEITRSIWLVVASRGTGIFTGRRQGCHFRSANASRGVFCTATDRPQSSKWGLGRTRRLNYRFFDS